MIFIVEDDENIRQLEEYAIRNSGYEVKGMENGDELFAELKSVRPELILLEIRQDPHEHRMLFRTFRTDRAAPVGIGRPAFRAIFRLRRFPLRREGLVLDSRLQLAGKALHLPHFRP